MDEHNCRQIDKAISNRVNRIYSNPQRHRFYSCFQSDEDGDLIGPRGGKIRGRKTICCHCGQKRKGHANKDEQL